MLLPVEVKSEFGKPQIDWKIWILSTKLENLDIQAEDESLLRAPGKDIGSSESLETEVFIIGGGNAYVDLQEVCVKLDLNPCLGLLRFLRA